MGSPDVVEELRLLHSLTLALDESENLSSALAIVLKEVCRATGWVLGEAWIPAPDGAMLLFGPVWHIESERLRKFVSGSRSYAFRPGQGLPGRVWSSGKPIWVTDVRTDANFPRYRMARRVGLKAGFAIPVKASGETIAIIEFFVFEQRREDRHLIELVSAVALQLGGIIQRKIAEEAFKGSRYALEAERRERERVARELHDGVIQLLSSTLFRLRGLEEGSGPLPERARPVSRLLEQAIQEVRRISLNLGPRVLEELGLSAALRALGAELGTRTGQRVTVSCPDFPATLPAPLAWALYRILQEGLQNIEKHAASARVRMTIRWRRGWITASLRDDGKGFTPPATPALARDWRPQLGLRHMRERAEAVGGSVVIRSSPGEGTLLLARIPWRAPGKNVAVVPALERALR
ncbi:MAG TPA: GAF domain-containing protein [Planctomycetota bacterium]|nr:GAF domain-containing protein [Planctomycetota bacterium]